MDRILILESLEYGREVFTDYKTDAELQMAMMSMLVEAAGQALADHIDRKIVYLDSLGHQLIVELRNDEIEGRT